MAKVAKSITFEVFQEKEGGFVAKWDAPLDAGGITTQALTLADLSKEIIEAVQCHFDDDDMPSKVQLHFVSDPALDLREAA